MDKRYNKILPQKPDAGADCDAAAGTGAPTRAPLRAPGRRAALEYRFTPGVVNQE